MQWTVAGVISCLVIYITAWSGYSDIELLLLNAMIMNLIMILQCIMYALGHDIYYYDRYCIITNVALI